MAPWTYWYDNERARRESEERNGGDEDLCFTLYYHPVLLSYFSGTGKSRHVRGTYADAYIKSAATEWWNGYNDEAVVIIEDLDKYHLKLGYHLKIWSDHYPFPANIKGSGERMIRPEKIIITSNYTPEEIWDDDKTTDPINRRFKMVPYFPGYKGPLIPDTDDEEEEVAIVPPTQPYVEPPMYSKTGRPVNRVAVDLDPSLVNAEMKTFSVHFNGDDYDDDFNYIVTR